MAGMLTEIYKANVDAQKTQQYAGIASIELQARNDATRAYTKIVAVLSGWMLHRDIFDAAEGRRVSRLELTENAVTDAVDTLLTAAMVMTTLKAVVVGTDRYLCKNPVAPSKEPRYYVVEVERIAE